MEKFADAKEDENKKIVFTYPLVQMRVLTPEIILNIYPYAYSRILVWGLIVDYVFEASHNSGF